VGQCHSQCLLEKGRNLVLSKAQLAGPHFDHSRGDTKSSKVQWKGVSGGDQQVQVIRPMLDERVHNVQSTPVANHLEIIQDHDQVAIQRGHPVDEHRQAHVQATTARGDQVQHILTQRRLHSLKGRHEVPEQPGRVVICPIERQPGCGQHRLVGEVDQQAGLAKACWRRDERQRPLDATLNALGEARSRQHPRRNGWHHDLGVQQRSFLRPIRSARHARFP